MKKCHDNEGWETNRYKKLRITKKCHFYCSCDMEAVGKGEKCQYQIRRNRPHGCIGGGKRKLRKY